MKKIIFGLLLLSLCSCEPDIPVKNYTLEIEYTNGKKESINLIDNNYNFYYLKEEGCIGHWRMTTKDYRPEVRCYVIKFKLIFN